VQSTAVDNDETSVADISVDVQPVQHSAVHNDDSSVADISAEVLPVQPTTDNENSMIATHTW